jgi:hypothetical protein
MNNEEMILKLVTEIHDDQKQIVKTMNQLGIDHVLLKAEIQASRNGYEPHEVVQMLHWIDSQMTNQNKQSDNIKKAITGWLVPGLLVALVVGLIILSRTVV